MPLVAIRTRDLKITPSQKLELELKPKAEKTPNQTKPNPKTQVKTETVLSTVRQGNILP